MKNYIICKECQTIYKPTIIDYSLSEAKLICPKCTNIIIIRADKETIKSFE